MNVSYNYNIDIYKLMNMSNVHILFHNESCNKVWTIYYIRKSTNKFN